MVNMNDFKFGDRLKTREGRMAVYVGTHRPSTGIHFVVIPDEEYGYGMIYCEDNGRVAYTQNLNQFDIVGKWEDTQPTTSEAVSDGGF